MRSWKTKHLQAVGGDNRDVLLAVFASVRDRIRIALAGQRRSPELFPCLRIERADAAIIGRTDEDETSGGGDWAGASAAARVSLSLRERVGRAERHLPRDVARVRV